MFEPEVIRKQMYCIAESTCDIVGTFRRPRSDLAPREMSPFSPLVTPLCEEEGLSKLEGKYWKDRGNCSQRLAASMNFFRHVTNDRSSNVFDTLEKNLLSS